MRNLLFSTAPFLFNTGYVLGQEMNLKLWFAQPIAKWLEVLPIGDGSIGGMIFGGVVQEHIQFNDESLITGTTQTLGFHQLFGNVFIDFPIQKVQNYIRELDLNKGIHEVGIKSYSINYQRECFASYPDKAIVFHLTGSKKCVISGKIRLADAHQDAITVSGNKITATVKLTENKMENESQIQVKNKGGKKYCGR